MSGAVVIAVLLGLLTPAVGRAEDPTPSPHVLVIFNHPENFLDIRDRYSASDFGKNEILSMFREYITRRSAKYLPEGYGFYISFTDIKLAGAYPLWGIQEYRVITQRDPPGFVFGWAITDRSGDVVKKGAEDFRHSLSWSFTASTHPKARHSITRRQFWTIGCATTCNSDHPENNPRASRQDFAECAVASISRQTAEMGHPAGILAPFPFPVSASPVKVAHPEGVEPPTF